MAVSGRDDEVGALGELASPAVGNPVDSGEDRLAELPDGVEGSVEILALPQPVLLRHVLALAQIATDGEGTLACAGQDDHPDRRADRDRLDDLGQQCPHLGGDGVVGARSIQGDDGDAVTEPVVDEYRRLGLLDVWGRRAEIQ